MTHPTYDANPVGNLRAFAVATGGIALGFILADGLDRFVATRKPTGGVRAYVGRDAATIINSKPDSMRLAATALGTAAMMAASYYTSRRRPGVSYFFGGLAVGFGVKLLQQLANWYVMPAVFKVGDNKSEDTLANRLFSLEQKDVQDAVHKSYDPTTTPPGDRFQATQDKTTPPSYPAVGPTTGQYLAGRGNGMRAISPLHGAPSRGAVSALKPRKSGQSGRCGTCGGDGGCYDGCSDACDECGNTKACEFMVGPSDDLNAILAASGVSMSEVSALNPGGVNWTPGATVVLPNAACMHVSGQTPPPPAYNPNVPTPFGGNNPLVQNPGGFPAFPSGNIPVNANPTGIMPTGPQAFNPGVQPGVIFPVQNVGPVGPMLKGTGDLARDLRAAFTNQED